MKKTSKRLFVEVFSVVLSVFMLAHFSVKSFTAHASVRRQSVSAGAVNTAVAENAPVLGNTLTSSQTEYVKDVKFITGDSLEDAQKHLPEG